MTSVVGLAGNPSLSAVAKESLEKLSALTQKVVPEDFNEIKLEIKHFFSGAAVYSHGKIFMTLTPKGLALKLPEESLNILMNKKGGKPLQYFPKGPIKKDYVVLPKSMLDDIKTLRYWVNARIDFVGSG